MYHGEGLNAQIHLTGVVTAYTGAVWLTVQASLNGSLWKIVGTDVYSVILTLFYSISAAYHSAHGRTKAVMHKLDHLSIYLLVIGSCMPFCLVTLRDPQGWTLFSVIWGPVVPDMLQKIRPRSGARMLSVVIYTMMDWIVLIAVRPLLTVLDNTGFTWPAVGGVPYTVGIVSYAYDHRFRHWHGIWHLFVIAGSPLHFMTI